MNVTDPQKKELKKKLVTVMLDDFSANKLTQTDMQDASNIILDEVPKLQTIDDLTLFLQDLKSVWPLFSKVHLDYKGIQTKAKEKQIIDRLSTYIKNSN